MNSKESNNVNSTISEIEKINDNKKRKSPTLERLSYDFRNSRKAQVATLILLVIVLLAALASVLTPYDPKSTDLLHRLIHPFTNSEHWLGTDAIGRDVWARLVYGARVSLAVGIVSVLVSGSLGVVIGLVSGFFGGWVDDVLMRIADILLAFPFILLMLAVLSVIGPGLGNLIMVLGLTGWVSYARVVRGEVLSIKEKEFIEAARTIGAKDSRIIFKHIMPNTFSTVIVVASFAVASNIITEATLSFLGLGVKPTTPTWGMMLSEGREYIRTAGYLTTIPGIAICITVLGINLLGDWLRDVLDPRTLLTKD